MVEASPWPIDRAVSAEAPTATDWRDVVEITKLDKTDPRSPGGTDQAAAHGSITLPQRAHSFPGSLDGSRWPNPARHSILNSPGTSGRKGIHLPVKIRGSLSTRAHGDQSWRRVEYRMSRRHPAHTAPTNEEISAYWDIRIHDTVLSDDPPGTPGFYAAMDAYRYGRLEYLPDLVDFERWRNCDVLDLGCGAGLDLARFARAGARAVGVDLSRGALAMAGEYLSISGLEASLVQADAAHLPLAQESFDLVFCHGVLAFVRDEAAVVDEIRRVLRPDGMAILMAYNRRSWMYTAHRLLGLPLGHADAPGFHTHSRAEFAALLAPFGTSEIIYERLPATSNRRGGPGTLLFNTVVRIARRVIPDAWFRATGWHMIARSHKQETRSHMEKRHGPEAFPARGQR